MAEKHYYLELNGEFFTRTWETHCDRCGMYLHESYPYEEIWNEIYCGDCAFILGLIDETAYIKRHCFWNSFVNRAVVKDCKIYLAERGKKFPWEKDKKRQRHIAEYVNWRTQVFERDEYTCAICGQVGGRLNAHHIKPFKDYPQFRFDVNNGITLCEECHKRVHREKNNEWLHIRE